MKGLLVPVGLDEPIRVVEHDGTFATLYPLVGTDILERVSIRVFDEAGLGLYVDEEGLLKPDPEVNWRLSSAYPGVVHGQYLYGAGVIVKEDGEDIVDMPLPEQLADGLDRVLKEHGLLAALMHGLR